MRLPRQMTLALLWDRESSAISGVTTTAARMPLCRLAAMLMPMPVPQMSTPRSASPARNFFADAIGEVRVVHGIRPVRAAVDQFMPLGFEVLRRACRMAPGFVARVVAADCDLHGELRKTLATDLRRWTPIRSERSIRSNYNPIDAQFTAILIGVYRCKSVANSAFVCLHDMACA